MNKCKYKLIDEEHNVYQCEVCGHTVTLEADGPYENGGDFCAHCGREIIHPFHCECGYVGDLEEITLARSVRPGIAQMISCPGLVCCPGCRNVKFIPSDLLKSGGEA